MSTNEVLWDIPTRLTHWLIVLGIAFSWWSGEQGEFQWHAWSGYAVTVLVIGRVLWGFVGSHHSRFTDFVHGPRGVGNYLRGTQSAGQGHNPLGGWSVIALLALLLTMGVSGMFNSDDLMYEGPFYYGASVEFRDTMGVVHEIAFDLLCVLVAVHLFAVLYYQLVKKVPLIQAMVKGRAEGRSASVAPVPAWRALVILMVLSGLLRLGCKINRQPEQSG